VSEAAAPALRIRDLHKSFGRLEVLRGIDLDVAEHEVICLIGASGSGKSTLLRCIDLLEPVNGGSIVVGGTVDTGKGLVSTRNLHVFIAVREGALLDASGSQAVLDVDGLGKVAMAGNGGSIALAAGDGLYLDGVMRAAAGGKGAAGGSLSVAQDMPSYLRGVDPATLAARQLIIDQTAQPSALTAGLSDSAGTAQMTYGHARLGVDQVSNGGFGQLTLFGRGASFSTVISI